MKVITEGKLLPMVDLASNFKSIQRRMHNINYTKTQLVEGYEKTEDSYRKIRDLICIYRSNIVDLMNYEHGGKTMKTIKEGITTIGKRLKEDYFKNDSMYQQSSMVLSSIALYSENGDFCKRYANAMDEIGKAKNLFNEKLEKALVAMKRFEKDAEVIDSRRTEVKNKRYDLEKLMKKPDQNQDMANDLQSKFNTLVQSVLVSMNAFIGDKGIGEVVKDVHGAHYEFVKASHDKLRAIQ